MYKNLKVSIIGLGLIGGSLARALYERTGITKISAVDKDIITLEKAKKDGYIIYGNTKLDQYIIESDIIFICTPVKYTKKYLEDLHRIVKPQCIITDVGSTKGDIIDFANNLPNTSNFIGGHPMAGSEKGGYETSYSHLFENAYYILCPTMNTPHQSVRVLFNLLESTGAIPLIMDAEKHDLIVGSISHVPHIIASALVNLVKEINTSDSTVQMLAAGGFRDITRIASSNPEIWESIVISNASKTISILDNYIQILNNIKNSISRCDSKVIYDFFESAKNYRDSFPLNKRGLIEPSFEIVVDVVDKPGIIGEITSILGKNNINIKNINVSNSREYEQGCLRITFPDNKSKETAFKLLTNIGYMVFRKN
jgi:prephenate dehydrogenase